jgi:glycosyltransferase involved in cell wall biosynthesis
MSKILINGYFLCRRLTGIERYACEITRRLDVISKPKEIAIIIPGNFNDVPPYKNLEVIKYKKKLPHVFWQLITLQFFLLTHKQYTILDFSNTCLPLAPGIVFLHDIYCEFFPEDFTAFRDKLARIYNKWQYRLIAKKAKKIGTVSQFSRNQIAEKYHIDPGKITVACNGWEHFKTISADYSVFDDFPILRTPFYFSLGSLSKRKNLQWIVNYALKNPDALFVVSGTSLPSMRVDEIENGASWNNIIFLGYLTDGKVKALMEKCAAFLFPSYYEGFGVPPLEALSCGAQVIVARAASLPEIFGNTVHYIDPFNTDVELDKLLREPVDPPDKILKKYSYDSAAQKVYEMIQK